MRLLVGLALLLAPAATVAKPLPPPVIDMHLHAYPVGDTAGAPTCPGSRRPFYLPMDPREPFAPSKLLACTDPFHAPATDEALMRESIVALKKYNVRHAVTSGDLPDVTKWRGAAPDRIIPAIAFADDVNKFSVPEFRRLHDAGSFSVFAEVSNEYLAWRPTRGGSHTSQWPKSSTFLSAFTWAKGRSTAATCRIRDFRVRFTIPLLLEDVLVRIPSSGSYAMHYGSPMVEQTIAMMFTYQISTSTLHATTG